MRSGASTLTSSSPETPVASWSSFRSLDRRQVLRGQGADVRDGFDLGAQAPADDGQGQADAQDAVLGREMARDRRRSGGAGPVRGEEPAGGGFASVLGPSPGASRARSRLLRALAPKAEGGEAGGQGEDEGESDADEEEQAEAADHRGRGEQEGEEAGGGGQAGGGDRGAAGGCGGSGRFGAGPGRPRSASSKRAWNWIA